MKIYFATHNENKVKEIAALVPSTISLYGLSELGLYEEIPETGTTMEENSRIKAQYVYSKFNVPVFADDSGLEVIALNGEPGVFSARYAGPEKNDQKNIDLLLKNLESHSDRSAKFKTVITFIDKKGKAIQFVGTIEGTIEQKIVGKNGFGYDPIFTPNGYTKTFAEMTADEKNKISHRSRSFDKLLSYLHSVDENA